ncbi:MAG: DUF6157 family protein [Bacteroidia bacterium]
MKVHTTNYYDTFIQVAEDSPVAKGEVPPLKGDKKTVANIQFELIHKNPYKYTSDELLFQVFANKNDLTDGEFEAERERFFSKGQPCLRACPLTKRYGWGVHYNSQGKIAIFGVDSEQYGVFVKDKNLNLLKSMRSSK